jgi:hypothetical protein
MRTWDTLDCAAFTGCADTIMYLRGAANIGLGATIKNLRRTTSTAAGKGLARDHN